MTSEPREPKTVITTANVERHEYLWKIHNFRYIKDNPDQRQLQKFTIETGRECPDSELWSKWTVGLKNVEGDGGIYRVYCKLEELTSVKGVQEVQVQFVAELRKRNGDTYWMDEHRKTAKVGDVIDVRNTWSKNTNWTAFLDPNTDAMTMNIVLNVVKPVETNPRKRKADEEADNRFRFRCDGMAEKNLATLMALESSEFDVKIKCKDGEELKCHKAILINNSTVFEKMLQSGMSEETSGIINVTDVGGKAMKILMQFLYTGNLLPSWKEEDVIVEFTYAACKYEVSRVLQYLDGTLGEVGSETDASGVPLLLTLLDLAVKLELKQAEKRIKEKIVKLTVAAKSGAELLSIFKRDD